MRASGAREREFAVFAAKMRAWHALTFYFRMKHTIRGHERETNVETAGGEEKAARRETEREPSSRNEGRERETLFVLRRAIREREIEREREIGGRMRKEEDESTERDVRRRERGKIEREEERRRETNSEGN